MKAIVLSAQLFNREIVVNRSATIAIGVVTFVICTALGAYVRIPLPFTPVPITLQTFFVLLSGAVLGRKWGPISQAGYLSLGLVGVPVFTGAQSGLASLSGPTGGYLIGFVLASWIAAAILQRKKNNTSAQIVGAMLASCLAGIYLLGIIGLRLYLHCSFSQAIALGLLPFIPGDILKIIAATAIYQRIAPRSKQLF